MWQWRFVRLSVGQMGRGGCMWVEGRNQSFLKGCLSPLPAPRTSTCTTCACNSASCSTITEVQPHPPSSWITPIKKMEKLTICLHRVSASAWMLILQFQSRRFNKLTFECSTHLPTYQAYLYYAPLEHLMLIAQTKCFTFISEKNSRARTPPQKYEFDDGVGVNWGDTIDGGRKHSAAKRWMIHRIWFAISNWCMYSIFYTPLPIYQG